jgi:hypothetical protein
MTIYGHTGNFDCDIMSVNESEQAQLVHGETEISIRSLFADR